MVIMRSDAKVRVLGYAYKNLIAHVRMCLDDIIFLRSKLAILIDDTVIYSNLAHIM